MQTTKKASAADLADDLFEGVRLQGRLAVFLTFSQGMSGLVSRANVHPGSLLTLDRSDQSLLNVISVYLIGIVRNAGAYVFCAPRLAEDLKNEPCPGAIAKFVGLSSHRNATKKEIHQNRKTTSFSRGDMCECLINDCNFVRSFPACNCGECGCKT